IIPSREMKSVSRSGLAEGLFAGWRYTAPGGREPNPDFILNQPAMRDATIIIAGQNFGCGSSREHAVWALAEFGIRAIIAESFNEIFHGNCLRNGILPIVLERPDENRNLDWSGGIEVTIDLPTQVVTRPGRPAWSSYFKIDAYPKQLLLEGLDPIGLTLSQRQVIEDFAAKDRVARPWVYRDYSAA
ncbi:MAG: 3-isopropylmalate dehydratase small subunit, partial [Pseudomonadota bacterium]